MLARLVSVMHVNISMLAPSVENCGKNKYAQPLHTINIDLKVYSKTLFDIRLRYKGISIHC